MPAVIVPPMFGTPPGWVGAVGFDQSMPVRIAIGGGLPNEAPLVDPARFLAIITEATLVGQSNVTVNTSLNDVIRFYLMGEQPHICKIGGIAFPRLCPGIGSLTGAERIFWFYEHARASQYRWPIRLSFGNYINLAGMLMAVNIEWSDTQFGVSKFMFTVMAFPRVILRNRIRGQWISGQPQLPVLSEWDQDVLQSTIDSLNPVTPIIPNIEDFQFNFDDMNP